MMLNAFEYIGIFYKFKAEYIGKRQIVNKFLSFKPNPLSTDFHLDSFSTVCGTFDIGLKKKYNHHSGTISIQNMVRNAEIGVFILYQYLNISNFAQRSFEIKEYFTNLFFNTHIYSYCKKVSIFLAPKDVEFPEYILFHFRFNEKKANLTGRYRKALIKDPKHPNSSSKIQKLADSFYQNLLGEERTNIMMPMLFSFQKIPVKFDGHNYLSTIGVSAFYSYLGLPSFLHDLKGKLEIYFRNTCVKENTLFYYSKEPEILFFQELE